MRIYSKHSLLIPPRLFSNACMFICMERKVIIEHYGIFMKWERRGMVKAYTEEKYEKREKIPVTMHDFYYDFHFSFLMLDTIYHRFNLAGLF